MTVILINSFDVGAREDEKFLNGWDAAADDLRRQPESVRDVAAGTGPALLSGGEG